MAAHKFKIGQSLSFDPGRTASVGGSRQCTVLRQLPAQEDGQLQYRIKCASEVTERVVKESALSTR